MTGDLGEIDADGFICVPRPAEAVPEGGRRDDLAAGAGGAVREAVPADGGGAARGGRGHRDARRRPRIVLFTTEPIALRDANAMLQEEGFRGVMRLDEVRQVEKIPVLGTGKTDYKVLRRTD